MIPLEQASKEIAEIINKHRTKLEEKYLKIDITYNEQGVFLKCFMENDENITLRAIADYDRRIFDPPKNSKEYQAQGGHKALAEKMKITNPNAWKIEVKQTIKNQIMEIAFSGSESNWSADAFERDFVSTIIKRI